MIRFIFFFLAFFLVENVPPLFPFLRVSFTAELRTPTVQGATCKLFLLYLLLEQGYCLDGRGIEIRFPTGSVHYYLQSV